MSYQITIVGLGETGTSLGLALKYQKEALKRVGCDLQKFAERNAQDKDAVDLICHNIYDAVREADIIFLAIPSDEVRKTMELIGHDLKEDAVVFDSCPNKSAAFSWARQFLANPQNYASIWPAVNPLWLSEAHNGIHSAHEDLFKNGTFFICSDSHTEPDVVKLAADLASLAGAYPAFCDTLELDGLIAATYNLPHLVSQALFSAVAAQTSWTEEKKLAGKSFFQTTAVALDKMDQEEYGTTLLNNRENTLRMLNSYIVALKEYRDALQDKDEASLRLLLEKTAQARDVWTRDYEKSDWHKADTEKAERYSMTDSFSQMFLGALGRKKKKE